jgi:RNA polymerase sigma factor (sigma-70 family)
MSATITPQAAAAVRRPRRRLRFARDDELVRLLRAGDASAFEAIFDRHHRGILAFARHMVGSREEAEDVVQHTFIAAHRDLTGSSKPIQLKAWLYTIARNRCLSLLRARREERALEDVPEPSVEGLATQVQRRQDLRDMVADLQCLPEDQRAALVLSELGALSHEEVAEALGVRKDKVKALVFQARESLASSRTARDADCREIQEQLAVLRGGSLRRTKLRRHVEVCPACAAFKAEVQRQRSALALILPVAPTLALKEAVLGAALAAGGGGAAAFGGGAGAAGGGLLAAAGSKSLAAKVMTIAAVAGGATGGGIMAVDEISSGPEDGIAIGGAPSEQRSVTMVGQLRERARETATARAAERATAQGAPGARPEPAADAPERRRPLQVARAGSARAVAVAGPSRRTRVRRRRGADRLKVASPRDAPAQAAPAAPPAAALPATEVGPEIEERDDARGGRDDRPKDGRGWKRDRSAKAPAVELPAAVGKREAGRTGDDDDGDDDRDDGERSGRRRHRNGAQGIGQQGGKGPHGKLPGGKGPRGGGKGPAGKAPAPAAPAPAKGDDDDHDRDGGEVKERVKSAVKQAEDAAATVIGALLRR